MKRKRFYRVHFDQEKEYLFKNFRSALTFTNRVGELAETQGHHPDIHLSWARWNSPSGPTKVVD